jgi:hypothetical protein
MSADPPGGTPVPFIGWAKVATEFASLPGEFATVGKLSFIRKPLSHVELCSEKK